MFKIPMEIAAVAGTTLKARIGKDKRGHELSPPTGCRAIGLGLMLFGASVALLLDVQTAQAVTNSIAVDFNAAGELTNLFNDGYGTPTWSQNAAGGLAGSGGITIPLGSSDLYISKQGFPLQVGATYTVSAYYTNNYDSGYGGLGFTTLSTGTINGGYATPLSAIGVSFHGGGGYLDNNSATTPATTSVNWNVSLETAPANWFYFKQTLTCTGPNTFSEIFEIWRSDSNGNLGTKFNSTTNTGIVNPTLGAATVIYPFFGASQDRFIGADNFTATTTATSLEVNAPTNQVVAVGGTVNLSVTATGTAPFSYQWFKNNGLVSGATNSTLTLPNAGVTDSGAYYVAVTNAAGLALTQPATVMVGAPQLMAWGDNANGELGDGTVGGQQYSPESVATNVVMAAGGFYHSLFVKGNGTLWAMGYNNAGQLGDGTTNDSYFPKSVASNVVTVATGSSFSLFLKANGTLWAMGFNAAGQLGDNTIVNRSNPVAVLGGSNVVAVAAGFRHSLFLKNNGALWAMGTNNAGQLGDGTTTEKHSPVSVGSNVVTMVAGRNHSLYVKQDGSLWAMGDNSAGQLGDNTIVNRSNAVAVLGGSNVVAVAAGQFHSLFLKSDGTLWAMGDNSTGQLGDGTTNDCPLPKAVASNVAAVAAGRAQSVFVKSDGTLWAMGDNSDGQLGDGTITERHTPVNVTGMNLANIIAGCSANHTFGVGLPLFISSQPTNQTVVAGGNAAFSVTASGLATLGYQWQFNGTNLAGATAANYTRTSTTAAHAGDYTVVITNLYGSVTSSVAVLTVAQAAATVTLGSLSQTYDGTAKAATAATLPADLPVILTYNGSASAPTNAGSYTVIGTISDANYAGSATNILVINQATPNVTLWPTATAIMLGQTLTASTLNGGAASVGGSFAFTTPGTTPASTAFQGVTFTPTDTPNFAAVSGSVSVTVLSPAIITTLPTNQVVAVGGTVNLSVTATGDAPLSFQWLKNGGLILGATNSALSLTNADVRASGVYYVVVTNAYGMNLSQPVTVAVGSPQLLAWGNNSFGQLGDGTTNNAPTPEFVMSNVVTTAAGTGHTLFVKADNTLWGVGMNADGELGDGTMTNRSWPEALASNVVAVAVGQAHSLFLKSDGTLWGMGSNPDGELGDGTTNSQYLPESLASNVVAVAAGDWHSLYLKNDGTVWAMGDNQFGQLGDGTTVSRTNPVSVASNVVAVAAGGGHSLFLKRDHTLWAVGNNGIGQLGNGTSGIDVYWPESVASNVVAVAAGFAHSAYLTSDGTLWTMGQNNDGQLGGGTTISRSTAVSVASNVVSVAAGASHTLYVKSDGTGCAMGLNSSGQLGDGTLNNQSNAVSVAGMILANAISGSSASHTLAVGWPLAPLITIPPTNQMVVTGSPVIFTVTATGVAPLAYQWQFNATNLLGATNASYTLASATLGDAGDYTVLVTGPDAQTASATATLMVNLPTVIVTVTADPTNGGSATGGGVCIVGSNVVLTATASNNWQFVSWNDGSTTNPHTITVPATNRTYTAQFVPAATVTTVVLPAAGGFVTGGGLHAIGSTAHLTATAASGWFFLNWNGSVTNYTQTGNTNQTLELIVIADGTVTANFAQVENNFVYTVINNAGTSEAKIIGYNGSRTDNIVIPSVIGGLAVTTIGTGAFWWDKCSKISIPESVKTVEESSVAADSITFTGGADAVLPFLADGAFAAASEVILDYALPAAAVLAMLDALKDIFEDLVAVQVAANPESGGTCKGNGLYLEGASVPVSASPKSGWKFKQWEGGPATPHWSVPAPGSYTADFAQLYSVTVRANPTNEAGTVTGDGTHAEGDQVTNIAEAEEGWEFHSWSYGLTNSATNLFTMPAHDLTNTATFYVKMEGEAEPPIGGGVLGNGAYPEGAPVALTAVPNAGYRFTGWILESDSTNSVLTNAITLVVAAYPLTPPLKYKAHFDPVYQVTVLANPTNEAGTVTGDGTHAEDDLVTNIAVAEEGWEFHSWSYGLTNSATNTFTMPANDLTNTATFYVKVEGEAEPPIGGGVLGNGAYPQGTPVTLTAVTNTGYRFTGWMLESDSTNSVLTNAIALVVPAYPLTPPLKYKAHFKQIVDVIGLANPTNAGGVTGGGVYDVDDTNITLTATASNNWQFVSWNDGTTTNPYPITLPVITITNLLTNIWSITYTASFAPTVLVTVLANPTNAGSVTGGGNWIVGSNTVLTATAVTNGQFLGWNDGTTNNPYTIQVPATNVTYIASFLPMATITVEASPSHGGAVTGGGTFLVGSTNVISAVASNGWAFTRWLNGPATNSYAIVVVSNRTYTAEFVPAANVTIVINPTNASAMVTGGGWQPIGSNAVLTATALVPVEANENPWMFLNWNGTLTNYTTTGIQHNPWDYHVTTNVTQMANFAQVTNGFVYLTLDSYSPPQIEIIGYVGPTNGQVVIPKTIDGYKVTIIGPGAFWNNGVTNIVITGNVTNVSPMSITASVVELLGVAAGIFFAADAFEDVAEVDLVDMAADAVESILEDLEDDDDLSDLVTVHVTASPADGGVCSGSGLFTPGDTITIKVTANDGWRFKDWIGGVDELAEREIEVPDTDTDYVAEFIQQGTINLAASPEAGGTVSADPLPEEDGSGTDGYTYDVDTSVTLTATTNSGWRFTGWDDGTLGNSRDIEVAADVTTYTAQFAPAITLTANPNPSGYKASVSFTAALPSEATGEVVFSSLDGAFSTNALIGGAAVSLAITNLPRGTNLIIAAYRDGNYPGTTNTLEQVVTNHPPVATAATYYRVKGYSLKIAIPNLLTNVTDADGDAISLQSVGTSGQGATITTNSNYIFYLPSTGTTTNDSFTYTVSDGFGGSTTTNILVSVYSVAGPGQVSQPTNGVVNLTFYGIPNYTYVVETTTDLAGPWWTISTNVAGTNGAWYFTDLNATNAQQYYRAAQP